MRKHYDVTVCGAGIAGVAAALAVDLGIDPGEVPVTLLQEELLKNDVILYLDDGR